MKFKEFTSIHNLNADDFDTFLRSKDAEGFRDFWKESAWDLSISKINDDIDADKLIKTYEQYKIKEEKEKQEKAEAEAKAKQEKAEAEAKAKQAADEKKRALASMLITSGFNFDGYKIVKYSGYISGDDAVQIPRSGYFGKSQTNTLLTNALVQIRRTAIAELKEAAYDLGCNAVIGVDFDYITMEPQTANITGGTLYEPYVICVTANGNAVIIEKTED